MLLKSMIKILVILFSNQLLKDFAERSEATNFFLVILENVMAALLSPWLGLEFI